MCPFHQIKAILFAAAASSFFAVCHSTQALTVLHTFGAAGVGETNSDGYYTHADLVLSGNLLYGTVANGGTNGFGTIFSINTDGTGFTVLHSFTGASDGASPNADLVLCEGTLYGLVGRGTNLEGYGSIFSMSTNGENFNIIYTITDPANGSIGQPNGGLIMSDGTLYGTMYQGGISNQGTIFSLNTNGTFALLHQFAQYTDGQNPLGRLVLADGTLYGTTRNFGTNGVYGGTVFSISTNGQDFTMLHYFRKSTNFDDGFTPDSGLILNSNTLYGTTVFGGAYNGGTVYAITTNASSYFILHSFDPDSGEGKLPEGEVVMEGNTLYGTTLGNGRSMSGTIYSVNTDGGSFITLYGFSSNSAGTNLDGAQPYDRPVLAGNILYGTTFVGGIYGSGTVFSQPIVPLISSINISGADVTLNGTEGMENETCTVLTSRNLSLPLSLWTPQTTNILANGGDFTITVTNALNPPAAQGFYTLQVTPP